MTCHLPKYSLCFPFIADGYCIKYLTMLFLLAILTSYLLLFHHNFVCCTMDSHILCNPTVFLPKMNKEEDEYCQKKRKHANTNLSSQIKLALLILVPSYEQMKDGIQKKERKHFCKQISSLKGVSKNRNVFALTPKSLLWYCWCIRNGNNLDGPSSK